MKKRILLIIIFLVLLASNVYFIYMFITLKKEINELKFSNNQFVINQEVLDFTNLFIKKVLRSDAEISFETRLLLENKVRSIDDKEIFDQWQNFTKSKSEREAQTEVTKLLEILVDKLK